AGDIVLSEQLPRAIRIQEEPFGDPSIIAHGLLMDAASDCGVPVILGGQGGDEGLFGYPFITHSVFASSLRHARLRWGLRGAPQAGVGRQDWWRILLGAVSPAAERWGRRRSRERRRSWLSSSLREMARETDPELPQLADLDATRLHAIENASL